MFSQFFRVLSWFFWKRIVPVDMTDTASRGLCLRSMVHTVIVYLQSEVRSSGGARCIFVQALNLRLKHVQFYLVALLGCPVHFSLVASVWQTQTVLIFHPNHLPQPHTRLREVFLSGNVCFYLDLISIYNNK